MATQIDNLLARVDGVPHTLPAASILSTGADDVQARASRTRRTAAARRRGERDARQQACVTQGHVPRAIEMLALLEPGDMHAELAAASLL